MVALVVGVLILAVVIGQRPMVRCRIQQIQRKSKRFEKRRCDCGCKH